MQKEVNMITVYLTIGLPGSGKSYWTKKKIESEPNTVCINRDKIREMLKVDYALWPFNGEDSKRHTKLEGLIKESSIYSALDQGFNLIIDECHITQKSRGNTILLIKTADEEFGDNIKFVYVWFTENENNLEYRMESPKNGSRELWNSVIEGMKKAFQIPTPEELKCHNVSEFYKINREKEEQVEIY